MNLKLDISTAKGYSSKSQIARVLTESWVGGNIYCPSCGNERLNDFSNNSPVADFYCSNCKGEYELKSKKDKLTVKIVDGAFRTMLERINSDNNPNFFFLTYSLTDLIVRNFLVIPRHYFVADVIERRKPLRSSARRAGWIGCNILLQNIPESGKIFLIQESKIKPQEEVLRSWNQTAFLADQKTDSRGWTIEILRILEKIPSKNFALKDIYSFEGELQRKFPNNNFVRDKIRQQLQVLRDKGLLKFKGNGRYSKMQNHER